MSFAYLGAIFLALLTGSVRGFYITCNAPTNVTVQLENDKTFAIEGGQVTVEYPQYKFAVYEYEGTDLVNILMNNTVVTYRGYMPGSEDYTRLTYVIRFAGLAKLVRREYEDYLENCVFYTYRNFSDHPEIPAKITVEILHQASYCMSIELCKQLGRVTLDYFNNAARNPYNFGPIAVPKVIQVSEVDKGILQKTMNKLVDIAIIELVKSMNETNITFIRLPDVLSTLPNKMIFSATNGTFGDFMTLMRTKDTVITNVKQKFTVNVGFGLKKAYLKYAKYKIQFQKNFVTGSLNAQVLGVKIVAELTVDYNQRPCQILMSQLKITDAGKITLQMTGLGQLSPLVKLFSPYVANIYKNVIIKEVEKNLQSLVSKFLMLKVDCEKFRP